MKKLLTTLLKLLLWRTKSSIHKIRNLKLIIGSPEFYFWAKEICEIIHSDMFLMLFNLLYFREFWYSLYTQNVVSKAYLSQKSTDGPQKRFTRTVLCNREIVNGGLLMYYLYTFSWTFYSRNWYLFWWMKYHAWEVLLCQKSIRRWLYDTTMSRACPNWTWYDKKRRQNR